jgi:hypothetical protein
MGLRLRSGSASFCPLTASSYHIIIPVRRPGFDVHDVHDGHDVIGQTMASSLGRSSISPSVGNNELVIQLWRLAVSFDYPVLLCFLDFNALTSRHSARSFDYIHTARYEDMFDVQCELFNVQCSPCNGNGNGTAENRA